MVASGDEAQVVRTALLRTRRAQLLARVDRIADARRRKGAALDPDFAEQAVQRENDEVLDALDVTERRELELIRSALRRIDSGCFGICDDCGEDIDPLRLYAAPEVARCLGCQNAQEAAAKGGA